MKLNDDFGQVFLMKLNGEPVHHLIYENKVMNKFDLKSINSKVLLGFR